MTLAAVIAGILATWAFVAAVVIGIGLLVRRLAGLESDARIQLPESFWCGFAVLLLFLQAWHFVLPIRWEALAAATVIGACGWAASFSTAMRWLRETAAGSRVAIAVALLACLWLANRAVGPPGAFDSGMYHIPAVEWAKAHPLVPGLANLLHQLGFNNSSLLYAALLDLGPWRHRSEHLANGLLLAALVIQVVFAGCRLVRGDGKASDAFLMVLLIPCLYLATDPTNLNIASPTTDGGAILVTFVSAAWCVSMLAGDPSEEIVVFRALTTVLLLAAAVTIKLSTVAYSAMGWIVIGLWWLGRRRRAGMREGRALATAIILSIGLVAPWLARGVLLSGFPLFPSAIGAVDVDWRVPEDRRMFGEDLISRFGRFDGRPGHETIPLDQPWLGEWVSRLPTYKLEIVLPGMLLAAAVAVLLMRRRLPRNEAASGRGAWWLLVPIGAGLALWFVKAPQPRLVLHLTWSLAALSLAMATMAMRARSASRVGAALVGIVALLGAGVLGMRMYNQLRQPDGRPLEVLFFGPGPDHGLHPAPVPELSQRTTKWGLVLKYPLVDGRIWHAPLLTTHETDDRLRLREPGNEAAGFQCVE